MKSNHQRRGHRNRRTTMRLWKRSRWRRDLCKGMPRRESIPVIASLTRLLEELLCSRQILFGEGKIGAQSKCFREVPCSIMEQSPLGEGGAIVIVHRGVVGGGLERFQIVVI